MLTVKHIAPSGHETIWPAIRVSYQPALPGRTHTDFGSDPTIFIDRPGERGLVDTIDVGANGMWYVMNEQGKTVARYELEAGVAATPKATTRTFDIGGSGSGRHD